MTAHEGRGPLLPPNTILQNRYRILRLHDQGGSATVYLAERLGMETEVPLAVKELNPDAFSLAEFRNEVNVLYSLNHPNLPKVYDFFVEDGKHYLVMDFVEGHTLKDRVLEDGPLPEDQALDYAIQVAGILAYLHERAERKIIHRDVKPSNLMLTRNGRIKLLDFGIARVPSSRLPGNHLHAYTEDYASPEQKANRPADERSDIYSFGVTLHFLLTGTVPGGPSVCKPSQAGGGDTAPVPGANGRGPSGPAANARGPAVPPARSDATVPVVSAQERRAQLEAEARAQAEAQAAASQRSPGLSRDMRRIIGRCLRTNPADRYLSFADLLRDLQAYRWAKRTRLTRLAWTAAGVVALAAIGVAAKLIFSPSLYPVVGPDRVAAGSSVTLEAGLPAAWSGSLDSIVWHIQDTQALDQESEARGRYLSFSSTDLGLYQIQAYLETEGRNRPLTAVKQVEVYPALDVPSELLVGQPLTLRAPGATTGGGREYSFAWTVRGPVGGGAAAAPPVFNQTTAEPVVSLPAGLAEPGSYIVQVTATVKTSKGIEATVAGDEVTLSGVTSVTTGQAQNGNPSFEEQYGSGPVDWTLTYPAHLIYDKSVGHTGSRSLRFTPSTTGPASYAVQLTRVEGGSLYRLTVWVKGENLRSDAGVAVETEFRSATDGSYVLPGESVSLSWAGTALIKWPGSFDWRQLMLYFRIPPGDPVNLEVYLRHTGSGTLWFDDCVVDKAG